MERERERGKEGALRPSPRAFRINSAASRHGPSAEARFSPSLSSQGAVGRKPHSVASFLVFSPPLVNFILFSFSYVLVRRKNVDFAARKLRAYRRHLLPLRLFPLERERRRGEGRDGDDDDKWKRGACRRNWTGKKKELERDFKSFYFPPPSLSSPRGF